jgi:predicted permease
MGIITLLAFVFFVFLAFIFLQTFLSKKTNKWVGLILPIITFCFSSIIVLSIALDNYYGLLVVPIAFALFVPTAVLVAIYIACRDKRNKQRALEKVSVQDLE